MNMRNISGHLSRWHAGGLIVAATYFSLISLTANAQGPSYPRDITLTILASANYVDDAGNPVAPILSTDGLELFTTCSRHDGTVVLDSEPVPNVVPGTEVVVTYAGAIPNSGTYTCNVEAVVDGIVSDPSNDGVKRYTGQPGPPVIIVFAE